MLRIPPPVSLSRPCFPDSTFDESRVVDVLRSMEGGLLRITSTHIVIQVQTTLCCAPQVSGKPSDFWMPCLPRWNILRSTTETGQDCRHSQRSLHQCTSHSKSWFLPTASVLLSEFIIPRVR